MQMKTHVFLQARVRSTRLRGKIIKEICRKTILELIYERLRRINNIEEIVLVTGPHELNDELINEARKINLKYFCGSEENILDRFYQASKKFDSKIIIRTTGDCPLIDFNIISKGLSIFNETDCDILSINRKRTYPDGFDFEIFSNHALEISWQDIKKNFKNYNEFYHSFINPTKYMLKAEKFKNYDFINKINNSHLRFTLDYVDDFKFIKQIYEELYPLKKDFAYKEILELLKTKPSLLEINQKQNLHKVNFNLK